MTHTEQQSRPHQGSAPQGNCPLKRPGRGAHGVAAGGHRHSVRTSHQLDFCIDHLAVAPPDRTAVARTLADVRAEMGEADEPGQWAYDHLWARRLDRVITASPTPITTIPFLVRPWAGQWRWATPPNPRSHMNHLGTDTSVDAVVELLHDSDRLALLTLVTGAQSEVGECHLDGPNRGGRAPSVVMARRLGGTENPSVIGVWTHVDTPRHGGSFTRAVAE